MVFMHVMNALPPHRQACRFALHTQNTLEKHFPFIMPFVTWSFCHYLYHISATLYYIECGVMFKCVFFGSIRFVDFCMFSFCICKRIQTTSVSFFLFILGDFVGFSFSFAFLTPQFGLFISSKEKKIFERINVM